MATSQEAHTDVNGCEVETVLPVKCVHNRHNPGNIQRTSLGKAESSGKSYGTFLVTRKSASFGVSPSNSVNCKTSPKYVTESNLAFVNVSYEVPQTFSWLPSVRKSSKIILQQARYGIFSLYYYLLIKHVSALANLYSGLMLPGLNAIMGPTGSGKTT